VTGNTTRTIVVFSIISLVLVGVTVGGVQLLKARNNTYASRQQIPQKPQERQPQQSPKQEAKTDDSQHKNQTVANNNPTPQQQSQSSASQSNKTSPAATSSPAPQPANNQVANTGPTELATTGPSFINSVASILLVMLAIFLGAKVLQARALVRGHLN